MGHPVAIKLPIGRTHGAFNVESRPDAAFVQDQARGPRIPKREMGLYPTQKRSASRTTLLEAAASCEGRCVLESPQLGK
jgi:hypothetical protein